MTADDVDRALEIVKATDGIDKAKEKADEYLARAKAALPDSLPQLPWASQEVTLGET